MVCRNKLVLHIFMLCFLHQSISVFSFVFVFEKTFFGLLLKTIFVALLFIWLRLQYFVRCMLPPVYVIWQQFYHVIHFICTVLLLFSTFNFPIDVLNFCKLPSCLASKNTFYIYSHRQERSWCRCCRYCYRWLFPIYFELNATTIHPMGIAEELFMELPETMGNGILFQCIFVFGKLKSIPSNDCVRIKMLKQDYASNSASEILLSQKCITTNRTQKNKHELCGYSANFVVCVYACYDVFECRQHVIHVSYFVFDFLWCNFVKTIYWIRYC